MRLWLYDKLYEQVYGNKHLVGNKEFNQRASNIVLRPSHDDLKRIKLEMKTLEYLKYKNKGGKNLEGLRDLFG